MLAFVRMSIVSQSYSVSFCIASTILCLSRLLPLFNPLAPNDVYTECPGGNVPDFGRMFLTLKYGRYNPKHTRISEVERLRR